MMPQSTDRLLPEEMLAAEPARAASGQVPVRLALAQGLAWAVLQPAEPFRAGARRGEPVWLASGQVAPLRAGAVGQPQVASGQAVPFRAGAVGPPRVGLGQVEPAQVASRQVAPARLAPEEPPQVDPVLR